MRDQIWPCRKIGQPRVIIWINLVVLEHPILHTKFQGHRPFGSGEDDFLSFLPYMGMAAIFDMWPGPFEHNFVPPSNGHSIWNLASIIDDNSFWKIHCFIFFPYKSIRDQIWPCRKISQGQPRIIIWTNLVVLEHPILHTKFRGHRPFGSGEDDFLSFLPYMGMAAILVMWPGPFEQNFVPPFHGHSIWNLASIGPVVSEEKMFKGQLQRYFSLWNLNGLCCKEKNAENYIQLSLMVSKILRFKFLPVISLIFMSSSMTS